jgi:long-chain acyl-CoA synthetase
MDPQHRIEHAPWHAVYPPGVPTTLEIPDAPLWWPLEEGARLRSRQIAIEERELALTHEALWKAVRRWASWLAAVGVQTGDRVVLQLPGGAAWVGAFYGTLLRGAIAIPLAPGCGETTFTRVINDATPKLVLVTQVEVTAAVSVPCIVCDPHHPEPPAPRMMQAAVPDHVAGSTVAVLQYTSGTTGLPKGAMMSHRNLVANALQNAVWFGWTADDAHLVVLPLYHTWGLCCGLNSTLAAGGRVVLAGRGGPFDPLAVLAAAQQKQATILYGSATMLERLLAARTPPPRSWRHVKAGAMLSQGDLKARWDAWCPHAPLQQGYGLTEASPESHNNPPQQFRSGTVGVPLPSTSCRIAAAEAAEQVLPCGVAGEVQLRGPQVFAGYWRDEQATQRAFTTDGWLRTGDLGSIDREGYLTIHDRLKDLIKVKGYSVAPAVVEERLRLHPAVADVVVVGAPDTHEGERVIAFIVAATTFEADELRSFAAAGLARHEVPCELHQIDEIPRNAVGKPLRRVLREVACHDS